MSRPAVQVGARQKKVEGSAARQQSRPVACRPHVFERRSDDLREIAAVEGRYPAVLCGDERKEDRQSVVEGKGVSVRVDLGGRRMIKTKSYTHKVEITRQ